MTYGSNTAHDLAALREQQEREALISNASAALARSGKEDCVDCGQPIPTARLKVAPFAVRCIDCQTFHEQEKLHR